MESQPSQATERFSVPFDPQSTPDECAVVPASHHTQPPVGGRWARARHVFARRRLRSSWVLRVAVSSSLLLAVGEAIGAGGATGLAVRAPDSLEALMRAFASSGGVRARFEETRTLSILVAPIESRGFLYFSPPDRLARVTTHPGASTVVVHGTHVAFADETGHREVDLATSEVARSLVGNLLVLLRGDLPELRAIYETTYAVEGSRWELDLVPRSRALRAVVERVTVTGVGKTLMGLGTFETNGDAIVSRFTKVESGLDFDAGPGADVFSLEPAGQNR